GDLLLPAERAAGIDLHLDLAAALLLDQLDELLRADPLGMIDGIHDRHLDRALLDVCALRACGRSRNGQHGAANGQNELPKAGLGHGRSSFATSSTCPGWPPRPSPR